MADLIVEFDRDEYADGDPLSITVTTDPPCGIRVTAVQYSLFDTVTDPSHEAFGQHSGDPITFAVDGASATGVHRAGHGMLHISAVDETGAESATHAPVPRPRSEWPWL